MNTDSEKFSLKERLHYLHRFWRYTHRTEPDTIQFIREELVPGEVALDIGANKGIVTFFLCKTAGPAGRVIAFEPQPEMTPQIKKMARTFDLTNVEVHGIGLSDRTEKMSLFRGEAGSTAILESGRDWQTDEIVVDITTLDSFVSENNLSQIDFIKCDVDGYETQVLKGAREVLSKYSPKLLIEISEKDLPRVTGILKEYGYDDGVFLFKGKRYPTSQTTSIPYRHESATFRNFFFKKK